jgi:hypothetical protein
MWGRVVPSLGGVHAPTKQSHVDSTCCGTGGVSIVRKHVLKFTAGVGSWVVRFLHSAQVQEFELACLSFVSLLQIVSLA